MRIISGKYKSRLIKMPKGIRPTQGLVRKAFFDILGDIEGLSFLELFAGSGAVGIEALSRGAALAVFVEKDSKYARVIRDNLSVISLSSATTRGGSANLCGGRYLVISLDVSEAIKQLARKREKFDIVFLDPPYYRDLAKKTLQTVSCYDILTPHALVVAQHFKKDNLPDTLGDLALFRQARYGDTVLSFYRKQR